MTEQDSTTQKKTEPVGSPPIQPEVSEKSAPSQPIDSQAQKSSEAVAVVPKNKFEETTHRVVKALISSLQKLSKKKSIWVEFPEVLMGLFSADQPTRRVSFLFLVSAFGVIAIFTFQVQRYWKAHEVVAQRAAQTLQKRRKELVQKESEDARYRASLITLGSFSIELKDPLPEPGIKRKPMSLAVIDVVVLCDKEETRGFIEAHLPQVRGELVGVFVAIDREELMSRKGKQKIRYTILRKLNEWLPQGKVKDLFFSKIILS